MGTVVRKNERSWAIVIITEIKLMLQRLNIRVKSVGGESTLSVNKQSMFPDILLYADEEQTKILQGWELKMPDVPITDEAFIADAMRKAIALGLNSFVVWNFTYGKLYVKNQNGNFEEVKVWTGTNHIRTREDVEVYKAEWMPVIKEIIMVVNNYLVTGVISTTPIAETISNGLMTEVIQRNKELVAENLILEVSRSMLMERRLKGWWEAFNQEYDKDETNMYSAYAKSILLNWTNRIMFANLIKKYHNCAYLIEKIDNTSSPEEANRIIDEIISQGDFYNIFKKVEYSELLPEDTWVDIVDYNQFLISNNVDCIDQSVLQDILEKTVNMAKREIRGQYATPYRLADILCQITIEDWNGQCADLCAGTGTIAKAIIDNKMERVKNVEKVFQSTWVADKYAYPLQIANIALTSIEALNIPLNMFQRDIFLTESGQKIILGSPIDGKEFEVTIPKFQFIVSNLPFVKYNKIADDTKRFLEHYRKKILRDTGIEFKKGKSDIYNYLPFKLYELLEDGGRLGIIVSNSWLGSEVGIQFFEALQYYYEIEKVVISGYGKWFNNADVIATMIVMRKKELSQPIDDKVVEFFRTNKDLNDFNDEEVEALISTIVLGKVQNSDVAVMKRYSFKELREISKMGICFNSCVHDIEWIRNLKQHLIPITNELKLVRGERTGRNEMFYIKGENSIAKEYLVPLLKTSKGISAFIAKSDMKAFCCNKTIEELVLENDRGTLSWIRKFSDENYNPISKSINYRPWYQMPLLDKADIVTSENPDKRLFMAELEESVLVDQRLIGLKYLNEDAQREFIFALLNSVYGMFAIEANGFPRGQGVLDISKTRFQNIFMINPHEFSEEDKREIIELFSYIKARRVMNIEDELNDVARERFDRKVLQVIGCENLYEDIKKSLLSMQRTRHTVKNKRKY